MHPQSSDRIRHVLLTVTVANMLEWYDFAVYAFLAPVIAPIMFPSDSPIASLLLSVGTFGVGFLTRPVGAVVFGVMADRRGRKFTLLLTFVVMGAATLAIGIVPPFAAIGAAAPLVIVLARLVQGLAAGGVMGGATALLIEHAPPGKAGFFGSWQAAGQAGALLLGALAAATASALIPAEQLNGWGWRLPFIASVALMPIALYIRRRVDDSQAFVRIRQSQAGAAGISPLSALLKARSGAVARGFGITIIWTVAVYFFFAYVPLYGHTVLGLPISTTLFSNSLALALVLIFSPIAGYISDLFGRYRIMLTAALAIVVLIIPGFGFLLTHPRSAALVIFQVISAVLAAAFIGPAPAAIAELFPVGVRSSGVGLVYNCAVTLFGGFAPLIATGLVAHTGNPISPAWYVIFSCGFSSLALLLTLRTTHHDPC